MSVIWAPRARIAVKASWPGVSMNVISRPLTCAWYAPMCCVIPPNSPATTSVVADRVEELGLPVVDVAHHGDDGRARHELGLVHLLVELLGLELVLEPHDLHVVAELGPEGLERLVRERRGGRHHLARHEEDLHDVGRRTVRLLREDLRRRSADDLQHRTLRGPRATAAGARSRPRARRPRGPPPGGAAAEPRRAGGFLGGRGRRLRGRPSASVWPSVEASAAAPSPAVASRASSPSRRTRGAEARGPRARSRRRTSPPPPSSRASPATPCWRRRAPSRARGSSCLLQRLLDVVPKPSEFLLGQPRAQRPRERTPPERERRRTVGRDARTRRVPALARADRPVRRPATARRGAAQPSARAPDSRRTTARARRAMAHHSPAGASAGAAGTASCSASGVGSASVATSSTVTVCSSSGVSRPETSGAAGASSVAAWPPRRPAAAPVRARARPPGSRT